ncbi:MAG TPA: APC family permease [bacterium]
MTQRLLLLGLIVSGAGLAVGVRANWPALEMAAGLMLLPVAAIILFRAILRSMGYERLGPIVPRSRGRFSIRQLLLGPVLATREMPHQTVGKVVGLAVFASDVLSSVAYATEEMLLVLVLAGVAAFGLSIPLSMAITGLLVVLTISYRQTIFAYPSGGGAYIVARDNLGEGPAATAGAALLTDYILTVAVSIASGVAQIVSAFPALARFRVELAVAAIVFMMLVNLRGVRESGTFFAFPTYFFVAAMLAMLGTGFVLLLTGRLSPVSGVHLEQGAAQPLTLFLILRAFSSGSTAVTGTEAVSNGIQAFREPKPRNAAATMAWMSGLIGTMFIATTILAVRARALPVESETVISQLARTIYGPGVLHVTTLAATTVILVLAANTAFADFPRLAAIAAADGFLPRQLAIRGSRLVFSWGIAALAALASLLAVIFRAQVSALIPLYAIGVFLSFTLSQSGMVIRWLRVGRLRLGQEVETRGSVLRYEPRWRWKLGINAFGALMTSVVVVIFAVTKFAQGAWIVLILIPVLVLIFFRIHRHYQEVRRRLSVERAQGPYPQAPVIHVVLISDVHAAALRQVQFVQSLGFRWIAVHVETDPQKTAEVRLKWQRFFPDQPLIILPSPLRDLVGPIRRYVQRLRAEHPDAFIHVIMSQLLMDNLVEQVLHQNATVIFKLALQDIPMVAVTDVGYPLHPDEPEGIVDVVPGTEQTAAPKDRLRPNGAG